MILTDIHEYPKGRRLTFDLIRNTDESGVSGTGKVLEGVIFTDGTCVVRWVTVNAAQSTVIYDTSGDLTGFEKFLNIHVQSHPGNHVEIVLYDDDVGVYEWIQPEADFGVDKEMVLAANRFISWSIKQPKFWFPKGKDGLK